MSHSIADIRRHTIYTKRASISVVRMLLLFVLFLLLPCITSSQTSVRITLRPPAQNTLSLGDVWQASVTNSGQPISVTLEAKVTEEKRGVVFIARSTSLSLATGTRTLNGRSVEPISIVESKSFVHDQLAKMNSFPDGEYTVCVDVKLADGSVVATDCFDHTVTTSLPPILLTPYDQSDVTEDHVIWTWFMQPGVHTGEEILCDLRVVEILPNQTPEEALRLNPDVILKSDLRSTAWQTNFAARKFLPGHRYAWRVIAHTHDRIISESEIWRFTYAEPLAHDSSSDESPHYLDGGADSSAAINVQKQTTDTTTTDSRSSHALSFSLKSRMTVESANKPGQLSEAPAHFARIELDPTITMLGTPLSLSILMTTEKNTASSKINRGALMLQQETRAMQFNFRQKIEERVEEIRKTKTESLLDTLRGFSADTTAFHQQIEELYALLEKQPDSVLLALRARGMLSTGEQILAATPVLGFGNVSPNFTDLSINSVTMNGGLVEFNPGIVYAAAALGKMQRTVDLSGISTDPLGTRESRITPEFFRNVYAGRVGIGRRNGSNFIVTSMYAYDDEQSRLLERLLDSTSTQLAPQENYLLGAAGRLDLENQNLVLDGEFNAAMFTENIFSGGVQNRRISQTLGKIFGEKNVKNGSKIDISYALRGALETFDHTGRLTASLRMVGPGYQSIGVAGLRTDLFRYDGRYEQQLFSRRLTVNGFYGFEKTGFVLSESNTSAITKYGGAADLRLRGLPALQVAYSQHVQDQRAAVDSTLRTIRVHQFNASSRYSGAIGSMRTATALTFSQQKSISDDGRTDFTSNMIQASERLTLSPVFSALFSGSYSKTTTSADTLAPNGVVSVDATAFYDVADLFESSLGITFSSDQQSKTRGIFVAARFPIFSFGKVDARFEYSDFTTTASGSRNFVDKILRVIYIAEL